MTSKTLGNLTAADALTGTEEVYVVQSSNSRKSTTQDIADLGTSQDNMTDGTTNKNYTATEQTKLAGVEADADVTDAENVASVIHAATGKTTPVDADEIPLVDSAASNVLKKLTWANVKATLKAYTDTLYLSTTLARREVLTANRTYYVATTGSDSNDGLTSGTAFLTIQTAVNVALALDMSIYSVTISVGAGTFAEGTRLYVAGNGNARIMIQGAGYDQTTISGSAYAVQAVGGIALTFKDIDLLGVSVCVWARYGAQVNTTGTVQFSGGSARLIHADFAAIIFASDGTIRINSSSAYCLYAVNGGFISWASTMTIMTTKAVSFGVALVYAKSGGNVSCQANSVVWDVSAGAVTGPRYSAVLNGVIDTVTGGGASYFPGSIAGSTATGGQYA